MRFMGLIGAGLLVTACSPPAALYAHPYATTYCYAPDMTFSAFLPVRFIAAAFVTTLIAGSLAPGAAGPTHEWVGALPRRDTGFDRRTWQDTSAATVRQLIERLPDRIDSAAERRLARN